MTSNKKKGGAAVVGVGLGVAVVSALALGTYLLYGEQGAKNRKKAKAWMLKAKGEVLEEVEGLKEMSLEAYESLVHAVMGKYAKMKDVDAEDLEKLVKELKAYGKKLTAKKKPAKKVAKKANKK